MVFTNWKKNGKINFLQPKINQDRNDNLFCYLGIFGVTLLAPVLPAVAKDLPKNVPTPADTPESVLLTSDQIISGLSSAAATISALALTSCPYIIGAALGLVIVIGALKIQGK